MKVSGADGGRAGGAAAGSLEEIRAYLDDFLGAWGLDLTVDLRPDEEALHLSLAGPDTALLLDRRGAVLEALQLVLSKALPRRFGADLRVLVDSENYRQGREREIVEIARRTADRVKRLGEQAELSPMNPYERRIVHMALADDPGVTTSSVGEGPLRRVAILPSVGGRR